LSSDFLIRRTATAASVVLAAVVVWTAAQVFWPRLADGNLAAAEPAYRAGQTIDTPAEWHDGAPYTLVIFAQAACGACQRAQPYLRSLVAHLDGRADVVMAAPGREVAFDAQYGHGLGLPDDRTYVVPAGTRVRATPTLVLVDRSGQILGAWEGVGPEDEHAALTATIDELLKTHRTG